MQRRSVDRRILENLEFPQGLICSYLELICCCSPLARPVQLYSLRHPIKSASVSERHASSLL